MFRNKVVDFSQKLFSKQNKIKQNTYLQLCKPQEPGDRKLMICKYVLDAPFQATKIRNGPRSRGHQLQH